jgi:predicted HTH transcriptional regulator
MPVQKEPEPPPLLISDIEEEDKPITLLSPKIKTPSSPEVKKEQVEKEFELNPRQKELVEKLKTLKKITRKEYAQMLKISVPTAARDLKELVDNKLLLPKGPLGPGRWYELIEAGDK